MTVMLHDPRKPWRDREAAKRLYGTFALHRVALTTDEIFAGRWLAIRLGDGGSDNTAYDSHGAAVASARNAPSRCFYPRVTLDSISERECDFMLWYVRRVYDNGYRADPAHELMMPTRVEDLNRISNGS